MKGVKKLQKEISETVETFLEELHLDSVWADTAAATQGILQAMWGRIADRHGRAMEKPPDEETSAERRRKKRTCCLVMDGVMIPGFPDTQAHRFIWYEVKLAAVVDARDIEPPFYMASTGNAAVFGARLWEEFKSRGMNGDDLAQIMADGAPWIWNLAELHFLGVPQLLDLYHAAEHLHKTAKTLWPDAEAGAW